MFNVPEQTVPRKSSPQAGRQNALISLVHLAFASDKSYSNTEKLLHTPVKALRIHGGGWTQSVCWAHAVPPSLTVPNSALCEPTMRGPCRCSQLPGGLPWSHLRLQDSHGTLSDLWLRVKPRKERAGSASLNFTVELLAQMREGASPQLLKTYGCFPWSKAARPVYASLRNPTTGYFLSRGEQRQGKKWFLCKTLQIISKCYYCGHVSIFNHSI